MKVRISDNSIRFRLNATDFEKLIETGKLAEKTTFAAGEELVFQISSTQEIDFLTKFSNGSINVPVPVNELFHWQNTREFSFFRNEELPDGKFLKILIEHDLDCLHKS